MKQPSPRQTPAMPSRQAQVVMGQGTITPAVRDHLARRAPLPAAPRAPRQVVTMGQGTVTPAVRVHLAKAAQKR